MRRKYRQAACEGAISGGALAAAIALLCEAGWSAIGGGIYGAWLGAIVCMHGASTD